ncbi:hypothetical protein IFM89_003035 [Coptis chinensis]|uniref:Helicase C-terminal domain-containing protein n=1 Tax=Coptis chinensis TaxID=261450 RepID=A0A835ITN5_9MAGN|nr:hypothetical protein IFM89_003035 [Coptis chinensis]
MVVVKPLVLFLDGFKDESLKDIKDIERSKSVCQVLFFSATFDDTVKTFMLRVVKDGNQVFVRKENLSLDVVKQYKVSCPDEYAKIDVTRRKILNLADKMGQAIIFVHAKSSANALHKGLGLLGFECTTIHGAVGNDKRDEIVEEFKDGLTKEEQEPTNQVLI